MCWLAVGTTQGFPAVAGTEGARQEGQPTPPLLSGIWKALGNSKITMGSSQSCHALPSQHHPGLARRSSEAAPSSLSPRPVVLGKVSLMTPAPRALSSSGDRAPIICAI